MFYVSTNVIHTYMMLDNSKGASGCYTNALLVCLYCLCCTVCFIMSTQHTHIQTHNHTHTHPINTHILTCVRIPIPTPKLTTIPHTHTYTLTHTYTRSLLYLNQTYASGLCIVDEHPGGLADTQTREDDGIEHLC